ncbi:MAG TPA: hypothetical protein VIL36_09090 [Acidimicrobiales bacterium]
MSSRTRTRRAAALGALTMAAAAVLSLTAPARAHESPVLPPGDYTAEQMAEAEDLVHRTEEVLPQKYGDWRTLEELGFYDFGVNTPNGYRHFINPSWMADEHLLDPEYPESLVYKDHGNDHLVLEAAMFYLKPEHTMDNIPAEYAWYPGWHVHEELCVDAGGRFSGINVPGRGCVPAGQQAWSPPMMHVWIVDNECGHRFTGLGVTGAMCDVEGEHGHGQPPGTEHPPGSEHPHPTEPPGPGGSPTTAPPATHPEGHEGPPPATPVVDEPDYTG